MNKIRKGDQVVVLTGRDKGKRGTVTQRVDADHLVVDGVVKTLNVEAPGKFEVSDAGTLLAQAKEVLG